MKGTLIISLDFELHWGRFDKYELRDCLPYYQNTRNVIPRILQLFESQQISATWATVGSLMAASIEEWEAYRPQILPDYLQKQLCAYSWVKNSRFLAEDCLFAPDLVAKIIAQPNQELGTHTFLHYYTAESGQNKAAFKADLAAVKHIAHAKFQQSMRSLVFPRNQYHDEAFEVALEAGFDLMRTNPEDWYWKNPHKVSLLKKVFRTGDTLVGLGMPTYHQNLHRSPEGWFKLPASRLLRPYQKGGLFNQMRVRRIKEELFLAAENNSVYHLWLHPHNFGHYPEENMDCMAEIVEFFCQMRSAYGMTSHHMASFAEQVEKVKHPNNF